MDLFTKPVESKIDLVKFFERSTDNRLLQMHGNYLNIIAYNESEGYFFNKILKKEVKKQTYPWMVPHWKNGPAAIVAVMNERNLLIP